jgi:hypothetical protein
VGDTDYYRKVEPKKEVERSFFGKNGEHELSTSRRYRTSDESRRFTTAWKSESRDGLGIPGKRNEQNTENLSRSSIDPRGLK